MKVGEIIRTKIEGDKTMSKRKVRKWKIEFELWDVYSNAYYTKKKIKALLIYSQLKEFIEKRDCFLKLKNLHIGRIK